MKKALLLAACLTIGFVYSVIAKSVPIQRMDGSTTYSGKTRQMSGSGFKGVVVVSTNLQDRTVIVVRDGQVYKAVERPGQHGCPIGHNYQCKVSAGTKTWSVSVDGRTFNVPLMIWEAY